MTTVADVLAGVASHAEQGPTYALACELIVVLEGKPAADVMVALAAAIADISLDTSHPMVIAKAIHKIAVDEIARCKRSVTLQ